ncbi:NUDIX hydrolase [Antarcticimicrobium luteum]|uniref:NUDIX domain-containing protein n=1 Tax=Antarcticimicrobium luteum TaxID=2547397 RepID=A0A4R5V442_9RHOB|nr:NUDIX hydrolase [Antarcticimicrobium luteum]TDK46295.1 NUDIX domain-containing protein [Antarcticimicrobium luteum]
MAEQPTPRIAPFAGAKLALFLGPDLLVIQRDDRPDIPWPGYWDLPGGGREGDETPIACALRETREEVSLTLCPDQIAWSHSYLRPHGRVWFFAAHLPAARVTDVRLGDEGQGWRLMPPETYCRHRRAVPHFAETLALYLSENPATLT